MTICLVLLTRYHRLMSSVHEAKYTAMRQSLDRYRVDLSNLLKEERMKTGFLLVQLFYLMNSTLSAWFCGLDNSGMLISRVLTGVRTLAVMKEKESMRMPSTFIGTRMLSS
ncbi:unnamed protein product [Echinostoma caproni]|uniref:Uncharacterized protein n=1 Tax=Echinostoma caproni TaxID=27848 RepID=A0A3P8J4N9_9TREM|nr:unnamed protein product [Echinostoma caproni]